MNIKSTLQIKNEKAVISTEDMASLLGRKHLSVLRAIDAIPEEYLRDGMYFMAGGEVFISADGVLILNMSSRHLLMRRKIMMALFRFEDTYKRMRWCDFWEAMPHRKILKMILFLSDIGAHPMALMALKTCFWFKGVKLN